MWIKMNWQPIKKSPGSARILPHLVNYDKGRAGCSWELICNDLAGRIPSLYIAAPGVADGASLKGVEGEEDIAWRSGLLRQIGHKL